MNSKIKTIITEYAKLSFRKEWGIKIRRYVRDLKKHYKLTGQVGFALNPKEV